MNIKNKHITYILKCILYTLMTIQIIYSLQWMFKNITTVPTFGDTAEYIEIGQTLVLDEYRNIFYPLLLKVAIWLEGAMGLAYNIPVFIGQTLLCFGCIYYTIHSLANFINVSNLGIIKKLFYSLYVLSIPMITFMNFTVLPDSIALSMLFLIVTQCIRIWNNDELSKKEISLLFLAYLVEAMVRADRVYSCGFFIIIFGIIKLVKTKKAKKFFLIVATIIVAVVINTIINSCTQTPGIKGRISTNASFILLDRVVWMNMSDNYDDFSEEIKANISIDEAKHFDKHNNNVMYYLAPLLEERVGSEKASEIYISMAKVVWKNEAPKVVADILDDFIGFEFPHVTAYKTYYGFTKTNSAWNTLCMSGSTPELTDKYLRYYNFIIGVILNIVAIILFTYYAIYKNNKLLKQFGRIMVSFLGMCTIISLWFAVGDGAPPNDRYVLIGHATWTMIIIGILECVLKDSIDEDTILTEIENEQK